jgi:phosphatidylglycerophosphatase A
MINRLIASCFGIGYIKGGGSVAALVTCIVIWFLPDQHYPIALPVATLLITVLGIYVGNQVEAEWGKDSYRVVIDEVSGMLVTLLFVPLTLINLIAGFVLFRFFDMVKPLYIRKMENLPGGTGVMMDDVLAGIYANLVLQLFIVIMHRYQ